MKTKRLVKFAILFFVALVQTNSLFGQSQERWYVSEIGGNRVGYAVETSYPIDGRIVGDSQVKMVLNRLGSKTEMFTRTETSESPDGHLLELKFELKYSEKATKTVARIEGQTIQSTSTIGGKDYGKTIDFKGELLGPEGIRLKSKSELNEIGDRIQYQTFVPLIGASPVKGARTFLAHEEIVANGNKINAIVIEEKVGMMPATKLWLDEDYRWIKTESDSLFGKSAAYLADRSQALGAAKGTILPPEIFERTMIRSNVRFPFTSPVESMEVELTLTDPNMKWPDLESENQRILSQNKTKTVLRITRPTKHQSSNGQLTKVAFRPNVDSIYLEPNEIINSDNEDIVRIANEVADGQSSDWEKCIALKDWVNKNVEGDPGVVLASASETIKNRRGTCSEFATLLCSMIRAAGIPCRYSQGLVYMSGIWGGHAWVEARIGDRWIPLDAAINNGGSAYAARILFLNSALDQGIGQINGAVGNALYGNIEIKVLSYTVAGKRISTNNHSTPFEVSGNVYRNPGLGLRVEKDSSFEFSSMNDVFPKKSILALTGSNEKRILVQQLLIPANCDASDWVVEAVKNLAGKECKVDEQDVFGSNSVIAYSDTKYVATRQQGQQLLVIEIESANPNELLEEIQSWFSFD